MAISNWLRISLVSAWVVGLAEVRWLKMGFGVVVWLESKPASSLKDVSGLFQNCKSELVASARVYLWRQQASK